MRMAHMSRSRSGDFVLRAHLCSKAHVVDGQPSFREFYACRYHRRSHPEKSFTLSLSSSSSKKGAMRAANQS